VGFESGNVDMQIDHGNVWKKQTVLYMSLTEIDHLCQEILTFQVVQCHHRFRCNRVTCNRGKWKIPWRSAAMGIRYVI
jgi:hypothetical protein